MDFLSANGQIVPVEIRRRKNTRHLRLTLSHKNQIVASVPWHTSKRSVVKFMEKQRIWLDAQLSATRGSGGTTHQSQHQHQRARASSTGTQAQVPAAGGESAGSK